MDGIPLILVFVLAPAIQNAHLRSFSIMQSGLKLLLLAAIRHMRSFAERTRTGLSALGIVAWGFKVVSKLIVSLSVGQLSVRARNHETKGLYR